MSGVRYFGTGCNELQLGRPHWLDKWALMPSTKHSTLRRFDLLLGSVVLSVLLLFAMIGGFLWLEL
jgi:hypothetical protein